MQSKIRIRPLGQANAAEVWGFCAKNASVPASIPIHTAAATLVAASVIARVIEEVSTCLALMLDATRALVFVIAVLVAVTCDEEEGSTACQACTWLQ